MALAVVVAGSCLAFSARGLAALLVIAVLSFAAAVIALRRRAARRDGIVVPLPALVCTGLAAYTFLQALPLPVRLLRVLSPASADVWQRCLLPFGEDGPRWASLSLDPGASFVEALKWATYAAVFATAASVSARYGSARGAGIVFGSALAAALAAFGLSLHSGVFHGGTLLNPNPLAGYLNLGVFCGLGIMLGHRDLRLRWLGGAGAAVLAGTVVITASRGGVAALLAGGAILAWVARRSTGGRALGALVACGACGSLIAILGATDSTWRELADKDVSKLKVVLYARPMLHDFPFFGVGRGAFKSVFPAYHATPGHLVWAFAENFVVQWTAEWGIPVAVAGLAFFAWAFGPRHLGARRSALRAGAWCGASALALQNLVDFGLELPAAGIGMAAVLGSLWGDRDEDATGEGGRGPRWFAPVRARVFTAGVAVTGAVLGICAARLGAHHLDEDQVDVRVAFDATLPEGATGKADPTLFRAELRRAILRHPAEPTFPLMGAMMAVRTGSESPLPWLRRSFERAIGNSRAHLLLAEILAARGSRPEALVELRRALRDDANLLVPVTTLALCWASGFDELVLAVPDGEEGGAVLAYLGSTLRAAEHGSTANPAEIELGRLCDREAIGRNPHLVAPRYREAMALIDALSATGPATRLCDDREACRAQIQEHAIAIAAVAPQDFAPIDLRARLLLAEGRAEEAVGLLERACSGVTDRSSCLQLRAAAATKAKAPAVFDTAAKALIAGACTAPVSCADALAWVADVREGQNHPGEALGLLERAAGADPGNEKRWLRLADAAARTGAHRQALGALEKVQKLRGSGDADLERRIGVERAAVVGGLVGERR